jgi:DNA primase
VSVWDFIIDSTISKYGAINGENKAKISRDLIPGLSQIADKIVQAHYAKVLSEKLEVPLSAVTEQISGQKTIVNTSKADVKLVENRKDRRALLEERLLALIFVEKLTNAKLDEVQELFTNPKLSRIVNEAKKYLSKHTKFDTIAFVQVLPPELVEGYTSLMMMEIGDEDTVDAVQELEKVVGDLKKEGIKKQQVELAEVMKTLEKSGKQAELAEIQKKYIKLAGELSLLEENSV